ncbi:MAG: hypothetical protein M1143_03125 [Candidatus Thermoplasmatota archaeon]|nr:hypothetical protein [Candidatus Thermoplasmatota archaeon]
MSRWSKATGARRAEWTLVAVVVALMAIQPFLPGASAAGAPVSHPVVAVHGPTALSTLRSLLSHPTAVGGFLGVSGVGAFTEDPLVANNTGINSTITLPAKFAVPSTGCFVVSMNTTTAKLCAILGIEEPTNATATAFVGAAFGSVANVQFTAAVAFLANGTFVTGQTDALSLGSTYDFSITHSTGEWWNFEYNGNVVKGSSAWMNGTYKLNVTSAMGIVHNGSNSVYPSQVLAQLNTSQNLFSQAPIISHTAIGIAVGPSGVTSYRPTSGNALTYNLSNPIGIEGHNQVSTLLPDSVTEGGTIVFPGQAASLWGNVHPLGALTPQAIAYATESGIAGTTGFATNVTVPSATDVVISGQEAEFVGIQEPLNGTVEAGVGIVAWMNGGTFTTAPYYFVRTVASVKLYISNLQRPASGSQEELAMTAHSSGIWTFDMGGSPIVNGSASPANGSVSLGITSASGFFGTPNAATTIFGVSAMPLMGVFGNGTVSNVVSPQALLFQSGGAWILSDYSYAWTWNSTIGVEGQFTHASTPRGEVVFGNVGAGAAGQAGLLWNGNFSVTVSSSPSIINPGQNTTVTANVSAALAVPTPASAITVLGVYGPAPGTSLSFVYSASGRNWAAFTATVTGPALPSTAWLNLTINVTAGPYPAGGTTLYAAGKGSSILTIYPTQISVSTHAAPATILGGQSTTVFFWVNTSSGPLSGSTNTVLVSPSVSGYTPAPKSVAKGEYSVAFTAPASLSTATNYTFRIYANSTGALSGSNSTTVAVTPLPLLNVVLTINGPTGLPVPAGGVTAGASMTFLVQVSSGGKAVSGASVSFTSSPLWQGGILGGTTNGTGGYGIALTAPKVNGATTFTLTASASLTGYRTGNSSVIQVVVTPPSSPAPSGLPAMDLYILVGVVVVVAVVAGLVLMMRKKKGQPQATEQGPAAPPEEQAAWSEGPGSS